MRAGGARRFVRAVAMCKCLKDNTLCTFGPEWLPIGPPLAYTNQSLRKEVAYQLEVGVRDGSGSSDEGENIKRHARREPVTIRFIKQETRQMGDGRCEP